MRPSPFNILLKSSWIQSVLNAIWIITMTFNILLKSLSHGSPWPWYYRVVHFQYSIEIIYTRNTWSLSASKSSCSFNILLKSSYVDGPLDAVNRLALSIFYWNHLLGWFLFWVLKFFLAVVWASWGRVSAPDSYGSCLFPRYALEIELMFPRNFNSQLTTLFPR